ncbi:hypothetical protein F183_A06830 [Bryobacterales bacterium F-183]|nr:hypothetical protein F183_A06830 [Bryobacterales bacterium F-183]
MSDNLFRLLFENLPGRIVVVRPEGPGYPVVAVSDHYLATVHKTREELVGYGLFDVFPDGPDEFRRQTIRRLRESFEKIIATRQTDRLSSTQRYDLDPEQERHWSLVSKPVLHPETGQVQYIVHEVEDVTAQVIAERRRLESEADLRHTVDLNTQIPWTANPDGKVLDFSPKWLQLTGLTREQALGDGWVSVPHPDDRPMMLKSWTHAIQTGEPYDVEHRVRKADGSYVWMHTRAYPRRDEQGNIVRWYGTTEDIDARASGERRNAFLVQLDDALRPLQRPLDVTETVARMLAEHLGVTRCAYSDVEPDERNFRVLDEWKREGTSVMGRYQFDDFGDGCLRDMEAGKPWVVEDSETDPRTQGVLANYRLLEIRAVIGIPVRRRGVIVAGLAVHNNTPRHWQKGEVEVVQQVASRCWETLERARVTAAMLEREERFRFLAESIPQMVWTADASGQTDYVNEQFLRYFAVQTQQVLGDGWLQGVHPDDRQELMSRWLRSVRTGEDYEVECRMLRASDQSWRWQLVRGKAMRDAQGKVTQWFGTCTDFEDLKQSKSALEASEERLQSVFQQAPVAILVLRGPDYIVELANPHYEALFGGRPFLGRPFQEVVPELDAATWKIMRGVVETGKPYHATEARIVYDFNQDGEVEDHWFNVAYNPLRDSNGTVSGFIAVLTEVTAQVQARRELERMNRELESFAYVASHDLQEPLRMVNIYSELLVRHYGQTTDERSRKFREFIQEGVMRMEALIRDLLSYSKSVQELEAPSVSTDLQAVLLDAQASLQSRIEEARASIILESGDRLPAVRGDASQLSQVLQNILSNALKYSKKDVAPEIRIRWRRLPEQPTHWWISFADNGIGFEQEYAKRIFGLFKRLHKDQYPGTGLGLAICQRILERHGGCIWAEGVLGEGAVFHFTLPAAEALPAAVS